MECSKCFFSAALVASYYFLQFGIYLTLIGCFKLCWFFPWFSSHIFCSIFSLNRWCFPRKHQVAKRWEWLVWLCWFQKKCPQPFPCRPFFRGQKPVGGSFGPTRFCSPNEESADHELYVLSQEKCLDLWVDHQTSTNLEAPTCQFRAG